MHVNLSYRLWLGSFALREFRPWNVLEIGPNFKEEPGRKCLFRWEDAKETESLSEKHLAPRAVRPMRRRWFFFSDCDRKHTFPSNSVAGERAAKEERHSKWLSTTDSRWHCFLPTNWMLRNICSIMLKTLLWLHLYQNSKKKILARPSDLGSVKVLSIPKSRIFLQMKRKREAIWSWSVLLQS